MKTIPISDAASLKNELRKYKKGKKFDINQFNQIARLAWLGKVVMQPLDAEDPENRAILLYAAFPDEFVQHFLSTDNDLIGHMHIVDGEQAQALIKILEQGVQDRAHLYQDLSRRDFYFKHFFDATPPENSGV